MMKKLIFIVALLMQQVCHPNGMITAMQSLHDNLVQHEAFASLQLSEQHTMEFSELFYRLGELLDGALYNEELNEKGKEFVERYKEFKGTERLQFSVNIGLRDMQEEDTVKDNAQKILLNIRDIRTFSMQLTEEEQVRFALFLDEVFAVAQKAIESFEEIINSYDQSLMQSIRSILAEQQQVLMFSFQIDFPDLSYTYIIG